MCVTWPANLSCERLHASAFSWIGSLCDLAQKRPTWEVGGCLRVSVSFSRVFFCCILRPSPIVSFSPVCFFAFLLRHCVAQYCVLTHCASLDVCGASSLQLCFCTVHVHIQCYSFEWRVFWPFFPLLWAALCFCWTNLTCLAVLTPRGQPSCFLVPAFISENTKDYPLPSWPPMFNLYHWAMRRWGSLVLIAIASKLLCPPLLIRWTDCVGLVYRFSQMEHWSAHQGVPSQSHTIVHSTCLQSIHTSR